MKPTRLLFVPIFLLLAGCSGPGADTGSETAPGAAAPAEHGPGAADLGEHSHAQGEPLPFLAIMRQLSVDMAAFMHALWLEDFPRMERYAAAIADHAPIDPADVRRIQETLGDDWEGFEEADHLVHEAAEELHRAVEEHDLNAILTRLDALQRGCVACHTSYRDRLLSEGSSISRQ